MCVTERAMRLWELVVQIYALMSLHMEAVRSRSTDVANMIVLSNSKVRAGRSIPSFSGPDELENSHYTSPESDTSKPDDFLRFLRGRDSHIRFGRGRDDNFMRFGRGKLDNFIRMGRQSNAKEKEPSKETEEFDRFIRSGKSNKKSESEKYERLAKNFMRFGRGKRNNLMRFGRGKQDNYMRFGRGNKDNFMRFGRGKQENFMRFGRGNKDNFMRFGRGNKENFMRFGRGNKDNFMRFGRGKYDTRIRFGRDLENFDSPSRQEQLDVYDLLHGTGGKHLIGSSDDNIPIAMRSSIVDYNNFDRFGRSRQDNFMRFGKSNADQQSSQALQFSEDLKINPSLNSESTIPLREETFTRVMKSKLNDDVNLLRQGRHPPNKDDSFIRFGRNSFDSLSTNLNPQRLKRSTDELYEDQEDILPPKLDDEISDRIFLPVFSLPDYHDEDLSSSEQQEGYTSRRKRSVKFKPSSSPSTVALSSSDDVSSKPHVDSGKLPDLFVVPLILTPESSSFSSGQ